MGLWERFTRDPFGFITRGLYKTLIGPLRYGGRDGYDAARYWRDRFVKHGLSLKAVGDEGLSHAENARAYAQAGNVFADVCRKEAIDFKGARVLEIGCGAGFYTQLLHGYGVKSYVGVDVTDVFFPELRSRFPEFEFVRKDITADQIEGTFDLVIMIDVIEHIVTDSKFAGAMQRVKNCLANDGVFIVSPMVEGSQKRLFYQRFWSLGDVKPRFPGYVFRDLTPFREAQMLAIRTAA